MTAAAAVKPLHVGLGSPLQSQDHFALQQILIIGRDAGISMAAFALRLCDLTPDELLEKARKSYEETLRLLELAQQSLILSENITLLREEIEDQIEEIDDILEQLEPPEAHEKRIEDLTEDREELITYKEKLDRIDVANQNAEPDDIPEVQSRFDALLDSFAAFKAKFRKRSRSNGFNDVTKVAEENTQASNDDHYEDFQTHLNAKPTSSSKKEETGSEEDSNEESEKPENDLS